MASHFRVFNLTLKVWIKHRQAQKAVENCAAAWVDPRTIRQLTLAEAIAVRNQEAKLREPMPLAEIPGLRVQGIADVQHEMVLAGQANMFFAEATQ